MLSLLVIWSLNLLLVAVTASEEKQHAFQSFISFSALTMPYPYDISTICSISALILLV